MPMPISDEKSEIIVVAAGHNDCFVELAESSQGQHISTRGVGRAFQEMLDGLAELEFTPRRASPLQKLCQAGSEYGLRILERTVSLELLSLLRPRAKQRVKNHLQRILVQVTRPCLALELEAFRSAYQAIYPQQLFSAPEL